MTQFKLLGVAIVILLAGLIQVVRADQRSFYGLILADDYSSLVIGSSTLRVGGPMELDDLLRTLDKADIEYSTRDSQYPFWGNGNQASATVILARQFEITWLRELGIICRIKMKKQGLKTVAGLSVGMCTKQVYDLFGQVGPLDADLLIFSTRETYSFMGRESKTGFAYAFIVNISDNHVSSCTIQFDEGQP